MAVTVQRQNEGSMAWTSRKSRTCMAAGNDRLVGLPSANDGDNDTSARNKW
jgi:hypothetical protein